MTKFESFIALLTLMYLLGIGYALFGKEQKQGYDCTFAEISPDIPIKVKEYCRKLRAN